MPLQIRPFEEVDWPAVWALLEPVAEWDPADPARRLRVLNATKTDMALADLETSLRERLPAVDEAIKQPRAGLPADVAQLKDRLEALAAERADHELRQLRDNRSYWDKRLARIERDLELEPAAIRRTFEVATAPRIEPAGAIVLWPLEATR
jgi:hypothetical protein